MYLECGTFGRPAFRRLAFYPVHLSHHAWSCLKSDYTWACIASREGALAMYTESSKPLSSWGSPAFFLLVRTYDAVYFVAFYTFGLIALFQNHLAVFMLLTLPSGAVCSFSSKYSQTFLSSMWTATHSCLCLSWQFSFNLSRTPCSLCYTHYCQP